MSLSGNGVVSFVRVTVLSAAGTLAMLYFLQSKLLYLPDSRFIVTPDQRGCAYEEVTFESPDGFRLAGWFIPVENPKGVILHCHGNGGNISYNLYVAELARRLGYSVFLFDYRGYGKSEGKITEEGTYWDAEGAWLYLTETKKVPAEDIIVWGQSLGGPIAAWLATFRTVKALILESTFTSFADIGSDVYPFLPVRLLARFDYNTLQYIPEVRCPVLIIHSPDDEIIPCKHGRRLFEAAKEPKQFLETRGTHNEGMMVSTTIYEEGIKAFTTIF